MNPLRWRPFRRALRRAAELLAGRTRLAPLMLLAAKRLGEGHKPLRGLAADVGGLIRMLRQSLGGRYRKLPAGSLVAVVAALIYFVNPLDVIPDVLPALGYADDAVVFLWVLRQLRKDLDAFLMWEGEWGNTIDVEASPVNELPELLAAITNPPFRPDHD